ncbi:hypothetical protein RhiirA1_500952 [Rhizophagus irregularis]|uniref:MATA-HMG n=4 Tax=Rhizophagus irregularis TaxID=588596 RepID=U9SQM9_RHIID|nr:hypothetical protein GLOIN_2v184634 [Rhizophagus irregularis DAOM 181602=DAOM 197198]ANQ32419.1 MATA-HMG [Rhizophagus irregularis]PKC70538.1 hypothetical protein RhiirA1_500952 [Rhizophagus irregularis]POG69289.1 hypothetical protein GLOIN_2v184634 [Rhizophagus irregularis DAOM 181602=DAOM 197198]UZO00281.1 hypothetical protein OCT59_001533 [Rhizophagus irregularis]CAB4493294.1 unnamed protein product [Rhizophagus irregularis]|eukprot:XP_025176155.1 hypothetical protein GLOIN_2v184634 [Rhizophagus irregularis DAOM 181602=DAOM 197198]
MKSMIKRSSIHRKFLEVMKKPIRNLNIDIDKLLLECKNNNSYMLYRRNELVKLNQTESIETQFNDLVEKLWKNESDEVKEFYKVLAAEGNRRYKSKKQQPQPPQQPLQSQPQLYHPLSYEDYQLPQGYQILLHEGYQLPLHEDYQLPLLEDYQLPLQEDYQLPLQEDYQLPLQEDYQLPLQEDYQLPLLEDYQLPLQEDYQLPLQEDYQLPPHELPLYEDSYQSQHLQPQQLLQTNEIQQNDYLQKIENVLLSYDLYFN